jgi:hypothetical protein
MKIEFVRKIIGSSFVLAFAFLSFSCQQAQTSQSATTTTQEAVKARTPSDAYRALYAAVKAKNSAKIQQLMSSNTMSFAGFAMEQQKQSLEKFFENGLTATTFADSLPKLRDERVNGSFGALEVYNEKDNHWEDLPFVLEDGGWKLAVGDAFKGTYKSPGKGQAQLEMEAGNSVNQAPASPANTNGKAASKNKEKKDRIKITEVKDENANKPRTNND